MSRTRGDTWLLTIIYTSLQEVQTVAVDGSVFKHHPLMKQRMSYYINKFAHPKKVYIDDRCQIIDEMDDFYSLFMIGYTFTC